ncbi:MAG: DUF4276 family protein [Magnetococcus sp. YQC-3]
MIRVYVICEGRTEAIFVKDVLREFFAGSGIHVLAKIIGRPGHKGGNIQFDRLYADLRDLLLEDRGAYCTTFFDFYGLHNDFPGKKEAQQQRVSKDKFNCVVNGMARTIQEKLGEAPARRFIPYIQMHEFEGLLFSDPDGLARGISQEALAGDFRAIRDGFASPEEINDSVHTAPSKRIEQLFPAYDKPLYGSLAAMEIGLETIQARCPLFNQWIRAIKTLTVSRS